jgi:hypothetical protein
MINIKDYREKELKWYILAYLLLVLYVLNPTLLDDYGGTENLIDAIIGLLSNVLLTGVICVLTFIFDSLYSTKLKEAVLFLGFTKMPGKTIFTRIKKGKLRDVRFSVTTLAETYADIIGKIPAKEKDIFENEQWYLIYSIYKEKSMVLQAHRDFLLCRDLYTTTLTLAVFTLIGFSIKLLPCSTLLVFYLVCMLF